MKKPWISLTNIMTQLTQFCSIHHNNTNSALECDTFHEELINVGSNYRYKKMSDSCSHLNLFCKHKKFEFLQNGFSMFRL